MVEALKLVLNFTFSVTFRKKKRTKQAPNLYSSHSWSPCNK